MNTMVTNLKRASVDVILLTLLTEEDMYGYQLVQEIKRRSNGELTLLEGSMYTILNRLKDKGDVTFYSMTVGKKMKRVYYHITDAGKEHLVEMRATYEKNIARIAKILDGEN